MPRDLRFRINCTDTRVGQHLRVVGSTPALGDWNPAAGVLLGTTAADFPIWRSNGTTALIDTELIEYKYVICDDCGRAVRWEHGPNRIMELSVAAIKARVLESAVLTLSEVFNMLVEADEVRFLGGIRNSSSQQLKSRPSSMEKLAHSGGNDTAADGQDHDNFVPTVRERTMSMTMMGSPSMSCMSHTGSMAGFASAEQLASTEAAATEGDCGDGQALMNGVSFGTDGTALFREESCSNLFVPEVDQAESDTASLEREYMFVGEGPLGEGTFGLVWRVRRREGGDAAEQRAAKIVKKWRLQPRDLRHLLGDDGEVSIHLTMKHPHIVELYVHYNDPGSVVLVMEYCCGGDLFDAIISAGRMNPERGRGLPERPAAIAAYHVLSALAYMHAQRVVHRDLKAENVLLVHAGVPVEQNVFKLCDFGFATYDRGDGLTERVGSPDTVAPEIVAGLNYSFPADMWSAGALVYMMLSATPPFAGASDSEVLRKVREGSYSLGGPLWDRISAPPKTVITSLMTVDSSLRPSAEQVMGQAWFADSSVVP